MKALAEADGDAFVPNAEPLGPVQYVLICMEPSLGRWARSADHAKSRVEAGFRNFLFSIEDFILHFCVRRYLCGSAQRYHITDLSKGAMLVDRAGPARIQRYHRWYALLQEEIGLCATPGAGIVAVGNVVALQLRRRGFRRPFIQVIHYSGQAGAARSAGIVGREDSFQAFGGQSPLKMWSPRRRALSTQHMCLPKSATRRCPDWRRANLPLPVSSWSFITRWRSNQCGRPDSRRGESGIKAANVAST